ncbi:hypothetical protein LCGC14_1108260 [marine sediment metagenome]|uniref:Uncharacterized protein n=1 Tax=marine sediment metagenome TaxID=412755 RepID=A0A0F9QDS6_9ZZZZ
MEDRCVYCIKRGRCPVGAEPQNVIMDRACTALAVNCRQGKTPDEPMDWIRAWIKTEDRA